MINTKRLDHYDDLMTLEDLSNVLKCSKKTVVKRFLLSGKIPFKKDGRKYLVAKFHVIQYFNIQDSHI